jgi:hypothetical protein
MIGFMRYGSGRIEVARWSFRALILCEKPKSNDNEEFEKERKSVEARVFHVVRLYKPTSTGCSQWVTFLLYSLYDILDEYNVL